MHNLLWKVFALWFGWFRCWKSQIYMKREGNHCNFWPNTCTGESHLYLREKNYFYLKTSNLEAIVRVSLSFPWISISYSIFQIKAESVYTTSWEVQRVTWGYIQRTHIYIFAIILSIPEKDEQYPAADNQRTCYSQRRWRYNVSKAKYLLSQWLPFKFLPSKRIFMEG